MLATSEYTGAVAPLFLSYQMMSPIFMGPLDRWESSPRFASSSFLASGFFCGAKAPSTPAHTSLPTGRSSALHQTHARRAGAHLPRAQVPGSVADANRKAA